MDSDVYSVISPQIGTATTSSSQILLKLHSGSSWARNKSGKFQLDRTNTYEDIVAGTLAIWDKTDSFDIFIPKPVL